MNRVQSPVLRPYGEREEESPSSQGINNPGEETVGEKSNNTRG